MGTSFQTVNPATGETIKTYSHRDWQSVEPLIDSAYKNFLVWRKTSFQERAEILLQLGQKLKDSKAEIAGLMHVEMGKLLSEGKAEVDKSILACDYYAKEGERLLRPRETESTYKEAQVRFDPLGPIFSIMPWNFPLWQLIRFAVPSIMAGNVILLKHSDISAGMGELIEKIFGELKSPVPLLTNLHVDHEIAEKIIAHPSIRGVTFTGSTRGGRSVATAAAKSLKKTVLELGGSDAYIVMEDANIEHAARVCAKARLVNCGQSCVAGKRFIVHTKVADAFTRAFIEEMKKTELGPLAHQKFQTQLIKQVEMLKSWGGRVVLGGTAPQGIGAYYPATVVVFDKNNPAMHSEEIFGPVASVIVVENEKEAFEVANASPFGLGGALFSGNIEKAKALVEKELEAGFVVVNDQVKSDPRLPFGGVKESGYGRELGEFGIYEFVNVKTVAVGGL